MSSDEEMGAFVAARLDEEQARAEAMEHDIDWDDDHRSCPAARTAAPLPPGKDACSCGLAERKAKRLREVEAGREIVARYEQWRQQADLITNAGAKPSIALTGGLSALRRIVRATAAIWNDHPDYRDWKP